MAEDRKIFKIKEDNLGEVRIADEVVAIIAGLAATEVEGVSSMAGNITNELVSKLGMKNLSKGVRVEVLDGSRSCAQHRVWICNPGCFGKGSGESENCDRNNDRTECCACQCAYRKC